MLAEGLTLFVIEGRDDERHIIESLEESGFIDIGVKIKCVFDAEIYQLYKLLKADDTDSLDIVKLLSARYLRNKAELDGLSTDDFAYIYLFFDYDAHATGADDNKINELLSYFNNETEHGLLYISYPMLEAIRHYKDMESFQWLTVKCKRSNCPNTSCPDRTKCLNEPHYKREVGVYNEQLASRSYKSYTKDQWREIITTHLCKMNDLVLNKFEMPACLQTQLKIFHKQMEKYISCPCPKVSVLSAFPLFLLDYYGCEKIKKIIS